MTIEMIRFGKAAFGMSDDQQANEVAAQRRFFAAMKELRGAIEAVNRNSAVVEIEPSALDDFLNDECPTPEYWDERLARASFG